MPKPWTDTTRPDGLVTREYHEHAPFADLYPKGEYDGEVDWRTVRCGLCRAPWPCTDYRSRHPEKDINKQERWVDNYTAPNYD